MSPADIDDMSYELLNEYLSHLERRLAQQQEVTMP